MAIAFDGSPSPSPRKEDPHSPPPGEIGFDFESHFQELWRAYPKKGQTKPPMAEQQYGEKLMAAPDREALHREILDAVTGKWARSKLWATGYINGLAEFLRLERWREDPEPAAGTDGGGYPEWPGVS